MLAKPGCYSITGPRQNISNTDFIILNTGSTRNRGLEGELYYDLGATLPTSADRRGASRPGKAVVDAKFTPVH